MIKEIINLRKQYKLKKPHSILSLNQQKNKDKINQKDHLLNKRYLRNNNKINLNKSRNYHLKLVNSKDNINLPYKSNIQKNKKLLNHNNLLLSVINNSSSNIFNSTTETSLNLNNYNNKHNQITTNENEINTIHKINNLKSFNKRENKTPQKFQIKNIKKSYNKIIKNGKSKEKKEKVPNYIISIKKIKTNYIMPLRKEYKLKKANNLEIRNKIKKIKNDIFESNKELKTIKRNKTSINLNLNKNLSTLMIQKTKSVIDINDITKLKEDINRLKNEIKITNKETILFKDNYRKTFNENKNSEKEIKKKKKEINKFLENKKKVKTMIILLHRRIIDIKERIKNHDIKKENLDKSWYELSLKYNCI